MRAFLRLIPFFVAPLLFADEPEPTDPQPGISTAFYKECSLDSNYPFFQVEFLYWKAQNKGFLGGDYFKIEDNFISSETIRVNFAWDPGLRLVLGWNIPYDSWSVYVGYTYFRTNVKNARSVSGEEEEAILWYWLGSLDVPATGVSVKWKLNENLFDSVLGKSYKVGESLFIFPFFGFRWGWLYQNFTSHAQNPTDEDFPLSFSASHDFSGGGPLFGFNSNWKLSNNFSLLANIATSLLYGGLNIRESISGADLGSINYKDNTNELSPNLQIQIGTSWGFCFNQRMHLELGLTWETNYWWNQCQLSSPSFNEDDGFPIYLNKINSPITQQGITLYEAFYF